jgi:hypothetical protein
VVANRYPSCSNDKRKLKGKVSASAVSVRVAFSHSWLPSLRTQLRAYGVSSEVHVLSVCKVASAVEYIRSVVFY